MTKKRSGNAFSLLIVLAVALGHGTASAYQVLSPGSSYAGKSIAAWNAAWWTWAWNSPAVADPLGDTSGALANQNNNGPVFFLAGSNSNGQVERTFNMTSDKALLMPTINFWENCVGDVATSCGSSYLPDPKPVMTANSVALQNSVTSLVASIDGTPIDDLFSRWEVSDFFSGGTAQAGGALTALYAGGGIDIVGQDIAPSLTYGYYALITNLSPGLHTLVYGGSTSAFGGFDYLVTAHINVSAVPVPSSVVLMASSMGLISAVGSCLRKRRTD